LCICLPFNAPHVLRFTALNATGNFTTFYCGECDKELSISEHPWSSFLTILTCEDPQYLYGEYI
jgi:hypothetical protein